MTYDQSLNLKWLQPDHPALKNCNFAVTNHCFFAQIDASGNVLGGTFFQPRDLNETFLERFEKRKASSSSEAKFKIYLPEYLKHRAETLLAKHSEAKLVYTGFLRLKEMGGKFNVRERLRVVSVDDSPVILKFLKQCFDELGYVDVVAQTSKSKEAVDLICKNEPDVVTMDIQMPEKTGVEVVTELMSRGQFQVIMISSLSLGEGSLVFEALNNGAFDYLQKPRLEDREAFRAQLEEKILLAVENRGRALRLAQLKSRPVTNTNISYPADLIWLVGASTGGTQALTQVFTAMPTHIPPTLIVQHIPPVFSKAFADSLNNLCPFTVKEAEHGELVKPDHVYIAQGGMQMGVEGVAGALKIALSDSEPVNRFKPSVDYMFKNVAKIKNTKIVAGILTGMGRDGAEGLKVLKGNGAMTFAQDEATSTVYGMPRAAKEIGATDKVIPLGEIAHFIVQNSTSFRKAG